MLAHIQRFSSRISSVFQRKNREVNAVENIPQKTTAFAQQIPSAKDCLGLFLTDLTKQSVSHSTIRNYSSDISQFIEFSNENNVQALLSEQYFKDFFSNQQEKGLKSSSIQRKIASLKMFSHWIEKTYLRPHSSLAEPQPTEVAPQSNIFDVEENAIQPQASEQLFSASQDPTSLQSSNDLNPTNTEKKSYPEWLLGPYFHLATLVIFFIFISILWYRQFFVSVPAKLAYPATPVTPERILSFQARLTDVSGTPITTATNTTFKLYDASSGGNLLWNSGTCSIDPDQDGIFSTILGSTCGSAIASTVFTENSQVWLEITVVSDVLTPRQRIATIPYALNSETVQGFPVNSTGSATKSTVLVMNQWGEVLLGEQSPKLQSVSGTFTISGSTLNLITNSGSNGDITLNPDGTGAINLTGNVNNDGYLFTHGATISATYSNSTPLTINGTGGQVLTVNNTGDLTTSGNVAVNGGGITSTGDLTISPAGNNVLFSDNTVLNIGGASAQPYNFFANSTAGNSTAAGDNDLYIQDILEVDGATLFDSSVTLSTLNTAGGIVYTNGSGQLLTSAAGSSGDCLHSSGAGAPTWSSCSAGGLAGTWRITNGTNSPVNDTLDLLVGSAATSSAKFAVINVNSGTPTATLSAGATGGSYLTANGTLQTTDNQALTIGGSTTGDITISPLNGSGAIIANIGASSLFNILTGNLKVGNGSPTNTLNGNDAYITDGFEVGGATRFDGSVTISSLITNGGILYTNGSGVVAQTAAGTAGECLQSIGGGTPTWGACGSSVNYWRITNGGISPINDTLDLLIGNTATTSAKFAVINVNSGTPTASLSAGAAGGAYLNATGTLQTTANQTLTLGGNTSGNIELSPLNGTGNVTATIGAGQLFNILTGNLKVGNGTPTNTLNGNDLYVTDGFEVDGATRIDGATTLSNASITLSSFTTDGGLLYTNGSGVLAQTAVGSAGQCLKSNAGGAPTFGACVSGDLWRVATGAISPTNDTLDLLIGSNATASAKFAVINVDSGTPTASLSAGAAGGAYLTATGVLQTTANQALTIGGSTTGDLTFSPLNGSGSITANIGASSLFNILTGNLKVGNGSPTNTLNGNDVYVTDGFEVDGASRFDGNVTMSSFVNNGGILYTNASGVLAQTAVGANGECLQSIGGGTPIWGTCGSTVNYWRLANGAVSTVNDTLDLLVGSSATASAKFAVINVNSGTPTASLSAGVAGGSFFTADGSLQTTANQNLTIGGSTTGNLTLSPQNGAGSVIANIGATNSFNVLTGNLKVGNGSPTNALNGNDLYVTDGFEVDGATQLDGTLTVSTLNSAGGIIYTNGSGQFLNSGAGSSGDCLHSGGTGIPTWSSCSAGGLAGTWRIANGAHSPVNDTLDLLVGSSATASAKFAVINVDSGTPTASLSAGAAGGTYLTATGALQTTANQALTIGGSTTGDITFSPLNGSGAITANIGASSLFNILTGNLKVGNGSPTNALNGNDLYVTDGFEVDGATRLDGATTLSNSSITLSSFTTNGGLLYTNGSGVLAQTAVGNSGECLKSIGGGTPVFAPCVAGDLWRVNSGAISPVNDTLDFLIGNTATTSAKFAVINVNSGTPTATLSAGAAGGAYLSATGTLQTTANQALTVGGNTTGDISFSPLNGTGTSTFTGGLTQSGGTVNLNVNSNNAVNIGTGSSTGTVTLGGTGTQTLDIGNGAGAKTVNLGSSNTTSTTTILSGTGGLSLNSTSSNIALQTNTSGNITATTGAASGLFNILTGNLKVGAGTPDVALNGDDAYITGTLETDGAVRFDNASITLSSFTTNGGLLYTNGSGVLAQTAVGSAGECLKSNAGGAPTFGPCVSGDLWRVSSGAISPVNDTFDLLIGNTATTSAKFAVINVNSGTPTATLSAGASGGAYLTANGTLQTTANQALTIGGSTTGDLAFSPLNGTGTSTFTGGLTQSGGTVNLNVSSNNAVNIGTGSSTGTITLGGTGAQTIALGNGAGAKTVNLGSSNTTSTTTLLSGSGGILINDSNNQPVSIGTGSSTGTVTLGGTGAQTISLGNGAGAKTVNLGSSNTTSTTTILSGSGGVLINDSNNQPTSIGTGSSTGTVTLGGTGTQTINLGNGAGVKTVNLGSNNTTSTTAILAGTGGLSLNSTSSNIALQTNTSGNITATTGAATGLFNILTGNLKVGSGVPDVTLNGDDAYITGTLEADGAVRFDNSSITLSSFTTNGGLLYTNGSGVVAQTAAGNSGECLTSNGGGAPTWTSCSASSGNFWRLASGAISPVNDTIDFLVGANATTSAKFAVINVNSGTPTASLSAGAAGGAYLTANGILQTTTNQKLTIGGATTGDLAFSPLNGTGTSTFTGGLTQSGGTVNLNASSNNAVNIATGTSTGTVTIGGTGTQTLDIGNGAGAKTVNLGSNNTSSTTTLLSGSGGILINDSNNQPVSIGTGSSTGTVTLGGTGTQTIDIGNGAGVKTVNLGSNNNTSTTAILSGTGGLSLNSTSSNIALQTNTSGNITATTGATSGLFNILTGNLKVGAGTPTVTLNGDDAYITGTLEADGAVRFDNSSITLSSFTTDGGLLYTNASGVLAQTAVGSAGQCLKSNAGGAPTFGDCATGNNWRIASGAISPINDTLDLLIGNTATTSAKFAVINVNSGTPTASLSAGTAGGAYLTATGTLQTTANQKLTIGGSTTGDLAFSPLNGTGTSTFTGGLTQSGGIVNLNVSSNNAINIGTGSSTGTVTLGGTGAQTIDIGNGAGAKTVNLGSSNTTSTTTLLSGSGGILINDSNNQPVSIGTGSSTGTVTLGGTGTQTIALGNGAGVKTVNLGSNNSTSTTAILSGTGGLSLNSTSSNIALQTNTSGNITATTGAAGGLFNVLTGNLKVGAGTPTVTLNGEDAYITGTLEADGAVRFDNSSITLSTFTANGGLLYTNASGVLAQTAVGNSGECLKSIGGGTPAFGPCAAGSNWRIASGAISPINDTLDLLIGNTATTSAKFAVINVNSGTPTATLSAGAAGGAYLTATGTLQTTANQKLTIGGSTTGDISLLPLNGQGGVTVTSDLSTSARSTDLVTLTQANDGTRNSTGQLLQLTNNDTGSTAALIDIAQNGVGGTGISFTADATGTLIDMTPTTLTSGTGLSILASGLTSGSGISMNSSSSGSNLAAFTGKAIDLALGRTYTGNLTVTDTGNFFSAARTNAQSTGTGTFAITGDLVKLTSTCSASGGTCTDSSHILTVQQNYASATGSVFDVTNAGTGVGIKLTSSSSGDLAELDASGAGTTANGLLIQQTGAGTLTDAIDVSDETITNALNVGANTITGAGYLITSTASGLTVNSTSANLALQTTTSGDITATTGAASGLFNVLTGNLKVGAGTPTVALNGDDAYITGTLEADGAVRFDNSSITLSTFTANGGILYTNASGVLAQTAAGTSAQCLLGGTTPAFGTCLTGDLWRINSGAISPVNDTLDLLVGNTATTSAKFAVINVNSGTPTATLSAGTAGGAYLTATGTLQTTANQSLTLGGNTTGNITLSPKSGAGSITLDENTITTTNGVTLNANALTTGAAFIIPHTTSVIANGGSLMRLSSTSVDTSTTTGTLLDLSSSASTAGTQFLQTYSGLTTGLGQSIVGNALTTGTLLSDTSTSTVLTTGKLASLDWSPSGSTEIFATTGSALLNLNVGQYGNIDKILNIQDNSSTVFSVGQSVITSALPHEFTAAGDVSVAYDLQFTNQTASYIKSNAPLEIQAGESSENNNLTLTTYGTGAVVVNGPLNGLTVTSNTTSTGSGTVTVSSRGVSYYLHDNSQTTNSSYTTTINITGVSTSEGAILFIRSGCEKGATGGSQTHTCAIQVNGTQISSVATATGTGASTVLENYVVTYLNGSWRIVTGTGTADSADYAELYKAELDVDAAEVVSLDPADSLKVHHATKSDKNAVIGITSTKPAYLTGDEFSDDTRKIAIALAGRVPLKIDPHSQAIKMGDPISASDEPGKGEKATEAGFIVGRALEDWTPGSGVDRINVFVNPVYYDPGYLVNQFGQLQDRTSALEAKMLTNSDIMDKITASAYDSNNQATNNFSLTQLNGIWQVINNSTGSAVNQIITSSRAMFGQIEAGLIKTSSLIADNVTVSQKLTSPTIETNSLKTSLIGPISNEDLTFKLGNDINSQLTVENASNEAILHVDQQGTLTASGDANFAGSITSGRDAVIARNINAGGDLTAGGNLTVTQDATVSGQFTANAGRIAQLQAQQANLDNTNINTATISGQLFLSDGRNIQAILDDNAQYLASVSAQTEAITQQVQSAPQALSSSSFDQFLAQLTGSQDASVSAAITALAQQQNITLQSTDMVLAPDAVFIKEYLNVAGYTQLSNVNVSSSLTVGNNLLLTQDSIASANQTLYIQPTATSSVNILAGLLVLNPDGKVEVNGDLIVSGNVKVGQKLNTNSIQPNDYSSDFTLKLATSSAVLGTNTESKFAILNASDSAVASIDASGSARFNELSTQGLVINNPTATATDSASLAANQKNQTIGSATLSAGQTEFTVENNNVSNTALINLTPTSDTANQVLYVKSRETCSGPFVLASCQKSFTVGIKNAVTQDISFNFWIVKVQ